MKKTLLFYMLLIASLPVLLAQPSEFDFTPNNTSGSVIAEIQIDGVPAAVADFIAAFDEDDNCAGAKDLFDFNGQTFCNFPVYGNDNTTPDIDEGIDTDETFTFKLWVAATGEILDHPMDLDPVVGWNSTLTGQPVPGWDFADGKIINFRGGPEDNDGDGFAGMDDPDDNDPCNPDNNVAVCDSDGDGIPDGSDPHPDCAGEPDECGECNGPGIPEGTCDCDGTPPPTWYADTDDDGLGDPNDSVVACDGPGGYVLNADDDCDGELDACDVCNGTGIPAGACDCAGTPPATWYADNDGDGLGDPNNSTEACDQPEGFVDNPDDPNDTCEGTLDECGVCNGSGPATWYADTDGDGLGDPNDSQDSCDQPDGYVDNADDDCDGEVDACGVCNGPGIPADACDCDGTLPTTWYADPDGNGLGDPNSSVIACDQPDGYVDNADDDCPSGVFDECGVCDGDGIPAGACDCDGTLPATWYADPDGNGLGDPDDSTESCTQPDGYVDNANESDCPSGNYDECGVCDGPGIPAGTCDCDGTPPATWYADNDGDSFGDPNSSIEDCGQPGGYVSNSNDPDDNDPTIPGAAEVPTLSQWGLILLSLILLSMTTVSIIQNKYSLAHSRGSASASSIIPYFNAALFRRMLLKSVPLMLIIFVLISFIEDGWFIRNLVGTILSTGVVIYLLHFIMLSEWFKNGQEK